MKNSRGESCTGVWWLVLALSLLVVSGTYSDGAAAQMIDPYVPAGYAGPVGSVLDGPTWTVQTVFRGTADDQGLAMSTAPVEIPVEQLDAAITYATFTDNVLDTSYLRTLFARADVSDINDDGHFSKITFETSYTPATFYCGGETSPPPSNMSVCLTWLAANLANADFSNGPIVFTPNTPTTVANSAVECSFSVVLSNNVAASAQMAFGYPKAAGTSCASAYPTVSFIVSDYDGPALATLITPSARSYALGDILAVAAYVPEVWPDAWVDKAQELTDAVNEQDGETTDCGSGDPSCIDPNGSTQKPLFYREGYSFTPGSAFSNQIDQLSVDLVDGALDGLLTDDGYESLTEYCATNPLQAICAAAGEGGGIGEGAVVSLSESTITDMAAAVGGGGDCVEGALTLSCGFTDNLFEYLCDGHEDSFMCTVLDGSGDGYIPESEIPDVDAVAILGMDSAGTCPAAASFVLPGVFAGTYEIDNSLWCSYLEGAKPILLIVAYLAAARIIAGGLSA